MILSEILHVDSLNIMLKWRCILVKMHVFELVKECNLTKNY